MEIDAAVQLALMVADGGSAAGPNTATVLAWEVRRLQARQARTEIVLGGMDKSAELLDSMQMTVPAGMPVFPLKSAAASLREACKLLREALKDPT